MNEYLQPMVQIRSNTLILYNKYTGNKKKSILREAEDKLLSTEKYTGTVTKGAIKRMSRAINLLVESSKTQYFENPITKKNCKFKLGFVTLTIPDNKKIEIKQAHKILLEPMLKWLRQTQGLRNYVWKLEVQKRGVIHWHLTIDCFVSHHELRNKWNKILTKAELNENYVLTQGHTNANSTDIHSVKNINNLASYLIKYFTKKEQNNTGLKGKIWDCSKNLKHGRYYETELTQDIEIAISNYAKENKLEVVSGESFTIIKGSKIKMIELFPPEVKNGYYQNLQNIRESKPNLFNRPKEHTEKVDNDLKMIQNKTMPNKPILQKQMPFFGLEYTVWL